MEEVNIDNLIAVAVAMAIAAGIPALLPRVPLPDVVLEIVIGASTSFGCDTDSVLEEGGFELVVPP
ncbi:MAG: hypothetical protein WA633_22305 [Stellaceae bacterium]